MIDRTSPTDLMQFASDLPGAPMQVAAVLVLGAAAASDLTAVRDGDRSTHSGHTAATATPGPPAVRGWATGLGRRPGIRPS